MRNPHLTIALAITLLLPHVAMAWNNKGHKTVAAVAWTKLSPNAKTKVISLLKKHPKFNTWIQPFQNSSAETKGMVAFINAATWPDFIKTNPSLVDDKCPSVAGADLGFDGKFKHRFWHFTDRPFSNDNTPLDQPCVPSAETKINDFRAALGNSAVSDKLQAFDLTWLIHLVGDVHQPLHATSRFTSFHLHGDGGGNGFAITDPSKELHAFWDGLLGTDQNSFTVTDASALASLKSLATKLKTENPQPSQLDLATDTWITESFNMAKTDVYSIGPEGNPNPKPKPSDAYRKAAQKDARLRVALAGYRLAAVLNEKFQ